MFSLIYAQFSDAYILLVQFCLIYQLFAIKVHAKKFPDPEKEEKAMGVDYCSASLQPVKLTEIEDTFAPVINSIKCILEIQ
jgi:hypothetical protein